MSPLFPDFKPKKIHPYQRWALFLIVWLILALIIGAAAGAVSAQKTIEENPKIVEITKEVQKEVTPPSCLEYIDLSERAFSYSSETVSYLNNALQAAAIQDVRALDKASQDINTLSPKFKALSVEVNAAKAECRAATPMTSE